MCEVWRALPARSVTDAEPAIGDNLRMLLVGPRTVGERTQSSTTVTLDLLGSRLTITTCDGLVDEITFD